MTSTEHDPSALAREVAQLRESLRQRELTLERVMREKGDAVLAELLLSQVVVAKETESARRDPLTGLLRHGFFRVRVEFEVKRSQETEHPLGLVLIDIDRFAAFNEAAGYVEGERALSVIARGVSSSWQSQRATRPAVVGRERGNCFAGLFPALGAEGTQARAEQARAFVERLPLAPRLTASVGACMAQRGDDAGTLLQRAAHALAEAKQAGRNRAVFKS